MLIPTYWAEARAQGRRAGRLVAFRRYGWSLTSEAEAARMANERAAEALRRALLGEEPQRREPKVPYNGADGVPIREEVIARYNGEVITRNSYGARCLNTPDAPFIDIDFDDKKRLPPPRWLGPFRGLLPRSRKTFEVDCRRHIQKFVDRYPNWSLRVYDTPSGWRLLVTHDRLPPSDPLIQQLFKMVEADPQYVRMCRNQQCFRARLSAKPWRIGIAAHMKPRPGVWPVDPGRLPERIRWVEHYEQVAGGYAACRYLETIGSDRVHPKTASLIKLHDEACQALDATRPLA